MRPALADWRKSAPVRRAWTRPVPETLPASGTFVAFAWNADSSRFGTTMPCNWCLVRIDGNGARQKEGCPGPDLRLAPFLPQGVARSEAVLLRAEERQSQIQMSSPLALLNSCRGQI